MNRMMVSDGSMTVYDDICDATRQGLIEHSTEPQGIYPYVFRMELIRVLFIVES